MRKIVARLARREGGLTALQSTVVLGAAFVVAWGLIEIWNEAADPLEETTRSTLLGERGTIAARTPTATPPPRSTAPPHVGAPPRTPVPARTVDPKSRSLGDLLLQLYTPEFNGGFHSPEALQEIDDRVSGNPLLWGLSPLVIPEVRIQQIKYQKTLTDKLLTIADGLLNQMDLIPSKKATTTVFRVADEAAEQGAKRLKGVMTRAEFDALEMTGKSQQEMRKDLFELMKKHPDQVHRGPARNGGEIWVVDLGDGTHGTIRLDPGELKFNRKDRMMGDIPHGHREIIDDAVARADGTRYKPGDVRERVGEPTGARPRPPRDKKDADFKEAVKNHPPMPNRGRFKWNPQTGKFEDEVQQQIREFETERALRRNPRRTPPSGGGGGTPTSNMKLLPLIPADSDLQKQFADWMKKNRVGRGPQALAAPQDSPPIPAQGLRNPTTTALKQLDAATFELGYLIPRLMR